MSSTMAPAAAPSSAGLNNGWVFARLVSQIRHVRLCASTTPLTPLLHEKAVHGLNLGHSIELPPATGWPRKSSRDDVLLARRGLDHLPQRFPQQAQLLVDLRPMVFRFAVNRTPLRCEVRTTAP